MIAVIFEVWPAEGWMQQYLDLAAALRADLEGIVLVERFQSLYEPGKLLSLSFFRDEAAVRICATFPPTAARRRRGARGSSAIIVSGWLLSCCAIMA